MPVIVAMNPKKKKKKRKMTAKQLKYFGTKSQRKEVGKKMPKKKGKKRAAAKKAAKVVYRKSKATLAGIDMWGAAKTTVPLLFGALVAKAIANRFAEGGGEGENWSYKNFGLALAAGFGAALVVRMVTRKGNAAKYTFAGCLLLIGYKLVTTKLAPMNAGVESWLGAADDINPYAGVGASQMWTGQDEDYVQGLDGRWRPISESHRLPRRTMGDVEVLPQPRYGDVEVIPNQRYGGLGQSVNDLIEAEGM